MTNRKSAALASDAFHDVVEAKDGQEAIDMVIRERPDLILLDVNMPGMNRLEPAARFARRMKDRLSW
jgi:CheY-like chemotaxis protein